MPKLRLTHWIAVSQLLLLMLVAALAWQAITAVRQQDELVHDLLRDYAQLIAETMERNLNVSIGFRSLYPMLQHLESNPDLFPVDAAWGQEATRQFSTWGILTSDIQQIEFINTTTTETVRLWPNGSKPAPHLTLPAITPLNEDELFRVEHPDINGKTTIAVRAMRSSPDGQIVVWLEPELIARKFAAVVAEADLLPSALGDTNLLRPHIYISLDDAANRRVFQTTNAPQPVFARNHRISGDYAGLLGGFTISVSISPTIADQLVIGGLPYGKGPFIAGLMAIALLLGAVSFLLLRRQRQVQDLRNDFVARVSHELRTPLTQIRMFAESLSLGRIAEEADRKQALDVINRETVRLGKMVDSILRFERPDSGAQSPEPEPYSLSQWASELSADFGPLLAEKDARLESHVPPSALTDAHRASLTQIMGNLLDNALKYGPVGQTIHLRCFESDNLTTLTLKDQGPGIPSAEIESIFTAYERLKRDRDNGSTGTGIGLSVARGLAESLGGELTYVADADNGYFQLSIPSPLCLQENT